MCSHDFTVPDIRVMTEKQSYSVSLSSHRLCVLVLNVPPCHNMASCALWTHMMCQRWLCPRIPVPILPLSDYYTNSLITRGQLLLLCFKHLFYSVFPQLIFFFFLGWVRGGVLFLFCPHAYPSLLCALPPPSLPLTAPVPSHSPHS